MKKVLDVIKNIAKWYIMAPTGLFGVGVLIMVLSDYNHTGLVDWIADTINGVPVLRMLVIICPVVYCAIELGEFIYKMIKKYRNK